MDEQELWKAIVTVVESGDETPEIDLKERLYYFKTEKEKGEFIKDVVAISNTLILPENKGYLVIGVSDSKQREGRREYILGVCVANRNELEQQMNNLLREYVEPDLTVACYSLALPRTMKPIAVIVIPCWQSLDPYNMRPCIIKKNVGNIRRGQIFLRARSDTYAALYSDISRLIGTGLQIQKNELEKQLSEAIERYTRDTDGLKNDYASETTSLYERIDNLQRNHDELKRENDRWRELSRAAVLDLYQALPGDFRERELRRLLARFGKDDCYSEFIERRK